MTAIQDQMMEELFAQVDATQNAANALFAALTPPQRYAFKWVRDDWEPGYYKSSARALNSLCKLGLIERKEGKPVMYRREPLGRFAFRNFTVYCRPDGSTTIHPEEL